MARSRSYQRSRHSHESNRRPMQCLTEALATFDYEDDTDDSIESDPALPQQNGVLLFWLSPRTVLDLHRDQRRIEQLLATDILFWHYNSTPEPIYAYG